MVTLEQQILERVRLLTAEQQQQVLHYLQMLSSQPLQGTSGSVLKRFIGTISPDDLALMEAAIEADLERIDPDAW